MENDEALMDFATWRVERGIDDPALVAPWNDHATRTSGVLWAGPPTEVLDALRTEAHRRGITFVVRSTRYRRDVLDAAQGAVWSACDTLAALGFELEGTSGTDLEHEGLTVDGTAAGAPDGRLSDALGATVLDAIAELPGVRGVIDRDDIRLASGNPVSNLLDLFTLRDRR